MNIKYILPLLFISCNSLAYNEPPPYTDMVGKRLSSVECMAINAYQESRSESDIANISVMSVVLNRVNDKRYPDTICGVVFQDKQFSWTLDNKSDAVKNVKQYKRLYELSEYVLMNKEFVIKFSQGVTHYHTTSISPYWIKDKNMKLIGQSGEHVFYKWR